MIFSKKGVISGLSGGYSAKKESFLDSVVVFARKESILDSVVVFCQKGVYSGLSVVFAGPNGGNTGLSGDFAGPNGKYWTQW